ncbi:MAG: sugar phosphate isomerase/epimerase family protein [Christensenellales bacterium]
MLRFFLATVADVSCDEADYSLHYARVAAPLAEKYGFGLELSELCIEDNLALYLDGVFPHFEENLRACKHRILHAPYNEMLPHAIDRDVAAVAQRKYAQAYALCVRRGIEKMVVHANFDRMNYHPEWFWARQIAFWKQFLAERGGSTVICLENVTEEEPALLLNIVSAVDDPRLQICLDVGHANLSPTPVSKWIADCLPHLSHVHLHNNRGRTDATYPAMDDLHAPLLDGDIDMQNVLAALKQSGKDITCTLETARLRESIRDLQILGSSRKVVGIEPSNR